MAETFVTKATPSPTVRIVAAQLAPKTLMTGPCTARLSSGLVSVFSSPLASAFGGRPSTNSSTRTPPVRTGARALMNPLRSASTLAWSTSSLPSPTSPWQLSTASPPAATAATSTTLAMLTGLLPLLLCSGTSPSSWHRQQQQILPGLPDIFMIVSGLVGSLVEDSGAGLGG